MAKKREDWFALDAFKAICIISMIFWHVIVWSLGPENVNFNIGENKAYLGSNSLYLLGYILGFSGFLPMSIPITAGAVFRFNLNKNWDKKKNKLIMMPALVKNVVVLSLLLAALGYLMNYLAWGSDFFLMWDVLQFIALSFVVIVLFLKLFSVHYLAIFAIVSVILDKILNSLFSGFSDTYLVMIFIGDKSGYNAWPFFPWFAIVCYGFILTHFYLKYKEKGKDSQFRFFLLVSGLILISIASYYNRLFFILERGYIWGHYLFHPHFLTLLGQIGVFNVLISAMNFYFAKINSLSKYGIINAYSKGILWIYIAQIIIGYRVSVAIKDYFGAKLVPILVFLIFLYLLSWLIGIITIKIHEKRINIVLKKVNKVY